MGVTKRETTQLPHLETFSKAAELSSFTRAAQALGLTQAAVSQRVHALERTLAKPLFQRVGGRVVLTPAGRKLYDFAQKILDLHRAARRDVSGRDASVAGELALAASSIPGEHLLPALLATFHQQFPHIQVRASVSDSVTVTEQVERGLVSLGLVGRKIDNPHLEYRFLANDRMILIAPPNHAWRRRNRVTVKEVRRQPLIVRDAGSGLRHCFVKSLEQAGLTLADLQIALELGSNEAIKEAVLRGVGVAVLSIHAVRKELQAGLLHSLEISDLRCNREMFIVLDRRRVLSFPARQFLTLVESQPSVDPSS